MKTMFMPEIPPTAPFNALQRLWLNGYLAALCPVPELDEALEVQGRQAERERVLILYASQSGNSESLAEGFGEKLRAQGFAVEVLGAEEHERVDLSREKFVWVISSTWGDGDPPDNAVAFWNRLNAAEHPRLEGLQYAVLGLGDSNYLDFCGMGRKFDERLAALGAASLVPRGECDVDYEETAEAWFGSALNALGGAERESEVIPATAPETVVAEPSGYGKKRPFPARLLENRRLNGFESNRDTRHLELSLEGSGLSYEAGDVVGIYPENDPELVEEILERLGLDGEEKVRLPGKGVEGAVEASLREALRRYYDIRTANAKVMTGWPETPSAEVHELIDLIALAPVRFPSAKDFIGLLRALAPRLYSIASSPRMHPNAVHLTVGRVAYVEGGRGRKGVCSTYLCDRVDSGGEVRLFLQGAKHFKLPADPRVPVIMVGPGTGIAPFRAFLQEREALGGGGDNWLFFGNPHEANDWLYREDLERMLERAVLSKLSTAWSRDQAEKVYVQDLMVASGAEFWEWLERGAHVYVCGDAKRMAKDVDAALHRLIGLYGERSEEEAARYVQEMKKAQRYQRDVY